MSPIAGMLAEVTATRRRSKYWDGDLSTVLGTKRRDTTPYK